MSGTHVAAIPCLSVRALCPVKIPTKFDSARHATTLRRTQPCNSVQRRETLTYSKAQEVQAPRLHLAVGTNLGIDDAQFNPGDADGAAAACNWDPRQPPLSWLVAPLICPTPQLLIPSLRALSSLCGCDSMVGSAECRCGSAVQCSRRLLAGAVRRALGAMRLDEHLDVGPELREGVRRVTPRPPKGARKS